MGYNQNHIPAVDSSEYSPSLDPIIERTDYWAVTKYGLECLTSDYPIEAHRLWEPDWVEHMRHKEWVDIGDFKKCLARAQKVHYRRKPRNMNKFGE